jgi:hypothetical protein
MTPPNMIIGFRSPSKFVYHYTKLTTARKILSSRSLKMGKFASTNDPKESKQWFFSPFTAKQTGFGSFDSKSFSTRFSAALKQSTRVACFSCDQQGLTGDHIRDFFLRGWSKPRMWAQYAGNHRGVCLVFDREALHEAIVNRFGVDAIILCNCVSYADRNVLTHFDDLDGYVIDWDAFRRMGFDTYVQDHLRRFGQPLFFEKLSDWRDEAEFRWVVFCKSEDDLFVNITSSLKGIMFGDRCPKASATGIVSTVCDLNLEYVQLRWKNSGPWYDFAIQNERNMARLTNSSQAAGGQI